MVAIIFVTGTKYACNESNNSDLICFQSWFNKGLNMLVIVIKMVTQYPCDLKSESDCISLQSLSIWTKYACNLEIVPESRDYNFWTNLANTKFR